MVYISGLFNKYFLQQILIDGRPCPGAVGGHFGIPDKPSWAVWTRVCGAGLVHRHQRPTLCTTGLPLPSLLLPSLQWRHHPKENLFHHDVGFKCILHNSTSSICVMLLERKAQVRASSRPLRHVCDVRAAKPEDRPPHAASPGSW